MQEKSQNDKTRWRLPTPPFPEVSHVRPLGWSHSRQGSCWCLRSGILLDSLYRAAESLL